MINTLESYKVLSVNIPQTNVRKPDKQLFCKLGRVLDFNRIGRII